MFSIKRGIALVLVVLVGYGFLSIGPTLAAVEKLQTMNSHKHELLANY